MSRLPPVRPSKSSLPGFTRRIWPRTPLVVEILEDRWVPAPYILTVPGSPDGGLSVGVDGFGAFGASVGSNTSDAVFDPIGYGAAGTTPQSGLAIRFNLTTGTRSFMTSGLINGTGGLVNPVITGTSTTAHSTFSYGGLLNFDLLQTVAPFYFASIQRGTVMTQTYTITNPTGGQVDFELVRFLNGNLTWDTYRVNGCCSGTTTYRDAGGYLPGNPDSIFTFDNVVSASSATNLVGITAIGGIIQSDRYLFADPVFVRDTIMVGDLLLNDIAFDSYGGADELVDGSYINNCCSYTSSYWSSALRNAFSLAPGASAIYITNTYFNSSASAQNTLAPNVFLAQTGTTDVAEGGAIDTYSIVLNSLPTANVTINLNPGTQLTLSSTSVTFTTANWDTPQYITVTAVDDALIEGSPHTGIIFHTATSADPGYSGIGISNLSVSITDNDTPGITLVQSGGSTGVAEGGATDDVTVALNTLPAGNVNITLNPNAQLTVAPNVLTFTPANYNVPQTAVITAVDDAFVEGPHSGIVSFSVTSVDTGYNAFSLPALTASIIDNDQPGVTVSQSGGSTTVTEAGPTDTCTVVLNSLPIANVVITLSPLSQVTVAPTVLTFTPGNYNVAQNITVTAVNDAVTEGNHVGVIGLTATSGDAAYNGIAIPDLTANITDDDIPGIILTPTAGSTNVTEGVGGDSYTIALRTAPTANVVVTLAPGPQLAVFPATMTFTPANWNFPQTASVTALDNAIAQGSRIDVVSHSAASADINYNGLVIASETVNIADNDAPGISIVETGGGTSATEGGTGDTYSIVLGSQPTGNVTILPSPNSQVRTVPASLVFTASNWNLPQTVTVSAVDDSFQEYIHTGVIAHTVVSSDPFYSGLSVPSLTVSVTDNDVPVPGGNVVQSSGSTDVTEGGATDSFNMTLAIAPIAPVTITFGPITQVTLSTPSLTFTPSDWDSPQTVTVTAIDDSFAEGIQTRLITSSTTSTDPQYSGLTLASIPVNIIDNDGSLLAGTAGADRILVTQSADLTKLTVSVNGKTTTLPGSLAQLLINAGGGNDTIQVATFSVPVQIDAGTGSDTVFVNGQAASNTFDLGTLAIGVNGTNVSLWHVDKLIASGKQSADTFFVQGVPTFPVELKGDAGADSVVAVNVAANAWAITGSTAGTLNKNITFSAVENLTGGADVDTFSFGPGKKYLGTVDGGSGGDVLDFSAYTSTNTFNLKTSSATGVTRFANVESIVGGKGVDTLIGADQDTVWNITTTNGGDSGGVAFRNIENLTGGALYDTFRLVAGQRVTGRIDGGGGSDAIDYAQIASLVTIDLSKKTASSTGGFANLEQFLGGSGINDVLIAATQANKWALTAANGGSLNTVYAFDGFENLTGGGGNDTFTLDALGSWTGLVSGGTGTDTLVAYGPSNNLNGTSSGTLNGWKFTGIEKHA